MDVLLQHHTRKWGTHLRRSPHVCLFLRLPPSICSSTRGSALHLLLCCSSTAALLWQGLQMLLGPGLCLGLQLRLRLVLLQLRLVLGLLLQFAATSCCGP